MCSKRSGRGSVVPSIACAPLCQPLPPRRGRAAGALTIGIANNPETPLLEESDHPILLDSGAEVINGSTRMGAGTAEKAALNLLTTLAMIRLGHVYDGLMVGLRVENAKL